MISFFVENIDIIIEIILAFITMSLGLGLTKLDFKNLFLYPKSLTIGLIAQMLFLPLIAFFLMYFTEFSPAVKVGFIIIAVCPGGVTSNLVSYLLKGNVALSISLTVINGLLCMFTIPFIVNLALNYYINETQNIELPVYETIIKIALITLIPAIIGVLIRNYKPIIANKIQPILKYLLPVLLLIVFLIKIFAPVEKGGIKPTIQQIYEMGIWSLVLNFTSMLVGYIISYLSKCELKDRMTIIIEVGLQNTVLALFIAGNILNNVDMQKPGIVYAMFTFLSTFLFGYFFKKISIKWLKK